MRILIAHAFYRAPGGEDRYVQQQAELLSHSHDIELFRAHNEGLTGLAAARRMLVATGQRNEIAAVADAFKPDLIHIHNTYPAIGSAAHDVARRRRIPLVMTVHNHRLRCPNGYCFTEGAVCTRCTRGNHTHAVLHRCFPSRAQGVGYASALWVDRFVRQLEKQVALFIAPSEYMKGRLLSWGIPGHRTRVIRNFTDSEPEPSQRSGPNGMYAGRLSSEKGIDVLLHALAISQDPPFDIYGDGPLSQPLQELAASLGLDRVTFHGRVSTETLRSALESARYFVMPSLSDENAPLAVLEALASGVPAIVTRRGGLPELVRHQELIVEAGDSASLAAAIERVRTDDELHSAAASEALRSVTEELSPTKHVELLENAYRTVLAEAPK